MTSSATTGRALGDWRRSLRRMSQTLTASGTFLAVLGLALFGMAGTARADVNGTIVTVSPKVGAPCGDGGRWIKWATGNVKLGQIFSNGAEGGDKVIELTFNVVADVLPSIVVSDVSRSDGLPVFVQSLIFFAGGGSGVEFITPNLTGVGTYTFLDGQGTGNVTQAVACVSDVAPTTTTASTTTTAAPTTTTAAPTTTTAAPTTTTAAPTTTTAAPTTTTTAPTTTTTAPTTSTSAAVGSSTTVSSTTAVSVSPTVVVTAPAPAARVVSVAASTLPVTGSNSTNMVLVGLAIAAMGLVLFAASVQPRRSL